jgi:VWFA-related protein
MTSAAARRRPAICIVLLAATVCAPDLTVQAQTPRAPSATFRAATELVVVSVVARDRNGRVVRDLTRDDFTITEDGRTQALDSFDVEDLASATGAAPDAPPPQVLAPIPRAAHGPASPAPAHVDMRGRRLMVLFFDLGSLQPEELRRSVSAARDYIDRSWSPADAIAIVSLGTSLRIDQDFTSDRTLLARTLDQFDPTSGQGFEAGGTGDVDGTPDTGGAFTADDTEFALFDTDRRLEALRAVADSLAGIQQKKSVIYFSSGMEQSGQDNQVVLRQTVDRAARANVSFYAVDMRGLQAVVPGGDATQASIRGTAAYSGAAVAGQFGRLAATQDTLTTLAEDTGGRAFFDANTFGAVFQKVVADTSAYYVLGYSSTNAARDGRYRRIKVSTTRPGISLDYRTGYYASKDFPHLTKADREQQLQDQLLSDLSATDLSAYVSASYFRLPDGRSFVPLSIAVPGAQLPITVGADKAHATLDVLGVIRDASGRAVGRIRDTVPVANDANHPLAHTIVQYDTGATLPSGRYHVKVVVRENQGGTLGSYETDIVVPDLTSAPLRMSSVVVGTQWQDRPRAAGPNPLVIDGRELIPNLTHTITSDQHVYFYYEVYNPATAPNGAGGPAPMPRVLTSVSFFRGRVRAFETPPIAQVVRSERNGQTAVFQFDVPASALVPGLYTCQVTVIDDVSGAYLFPRFQLLVRR